MKIQFIDLIRLFNPQTIRLLFSKPSFKVDYLSKYNERTKPENYNPTKNAASDYQAAFDAFKEMPETIKEFKSAWPADLTETELKIFTEWLDSNSNALENLKKATEKPYCWFERKHGKSLYSFDMPELPTFRALSRFLLCHAKWCAFQEQVEQAIDEIFYVRKIGLHLLRPISLVEQCIGLALIHLSYDNFFTIIDRCKLSSLNLSRIQTELLKLNNSIKSITISEGEYCYLLNANQSSFTDDENGNGVIIPKQLHHYINDSILQPPISWLKILVICINHPSRKETFDLQKKLIVLFNNLINQPPWKLHEKGTYYYEQIHELTKDNFWVDSSTGSFGKICEIYHRLITHSRALLATLAILRFRVEKNCLPSSLDECVKNGYMDSLPIDAFSGEPLKYIVNKNNFKLYSIDANFTDNGGKRKECFEQHEGDNVFWPSQRY